MSRSASTSQQLLKEGEGLNPARVPYKFPPPGTNEVADEVRGRRGARGLLALDGVVADGDLGGWCTGRLHSEPLAKAWNQIGFALRDYNTIPADIRELLILRVAVLNNAAFEWIAHEPPARAAHLTTAHLLAIRHTPPFSSPSPSLPPRLAAALLFADHSTKNVQVPQEVFDALRAHLQGEGGDGDGDGEADRRMVEAVATVAGYNMVSRVLVALDVDGKAGVEVPVPV
ncbi:hypothetical protein EIP91_003968 [Steccherinum ochraceum]|uniref:Carboxymuconolactone decarboxylase-like domain-containing protein n=1 Tax=Steccherinum ochraceum TaxID=92696 RepID=A0A4R0RWQ4_9APHY|nr:hypothetical protein EIP91_003968 [Steccherinum ochraceum]